MSDFYLSLPSHSNKTEFPDNTSNHFKIRLPYPKKLEGHGWKVGLSAISLPDPTSQTPKLMENDEIIFKTGWIAQGTLGSGAKFDFSAEFRPSDVRSEDLTTLTGVGFMKTVKSFFDKQRVEKALTIGFKFTSGGKKTYSPPKWEGEDLVIDNSNVLLQKLRNKNFYPSFSMNKEFALEMGWFKENGDLGSNLVIEVADDLVPSPPDTFSLSKPNRFWKESSDGKMMILSMSCIWRFINLNTSFKNVTDSTKRSLFVYSDVGGSNMVGNQVTDLLREVNYKREGKGAQYFEPLHIQYIPVRKDLIDIIKTQVAETTGDLVNFGKGNTIVTLHFKQGA